MRPPANILSPLAAFSAGLAVMLWPAPPDGQVRQKRAGSAGQSTLSGNGRAETSAGKTRLARIAESHARLAGMTAAEARDTLLRMASPPDKSDKEWWSALLTRWAEGEPAEALEWLKKENRQSPVDYDAAAPALAAAARQDLRLAVFTAQEWPYHNQSELFREAARINPRAAVEFAAARPRAAGRGLAAAVSEWLLADAGAALNWLQTDGKSRLSAFSHDVIEDLSALAPGQWDSLLAALPESERQTLRVQRAESEGRADPVGMMARLPELKEEERRSAIEGTVNGLLRLGEAAHLGRLLASLTGEERELAGSAIGGIISIPPEELNGILGLTELTFNERLRLLSEASGPQRPGEFFAHLETLGQASPEDAEEIRKTAARKWRDWLSRGAPEDFQSFGGMVREGKTDPGLPMELIGDFGRERNPNAAMKLLESLPEEQRATPLALHTGFTALRDPSADLAPLLGADLSAESRLRVFDALFEHDFNAGPDQTSRKLAFLERLPGNIKAEALAKLLEKQPADRESYAPALREMATAGATAWTPELTECLSSMALSAAGGDPAAGFAWAETAPPGPARAALEKTVFQSILREQTIAASEWLARQPEGRVRDDMARDMANQIRTSDPAGAWQWAASIRSDPDLRRKLQERILPVWRAADPEAAAEAVTDPAK